MALFVVALVALAAGALIEDLGQAIERRASRSDQTQARLLARGAVDWARNVLAEDARTSSTDHFREPWTLKVPPTPVEEGEVGGELTDWSGRFNLNQLAPLGRLHLPSVARFTRLLEETLGVDPIEAQNLANAAALHLAHPARESPLTHDASAVAFGQKTAFEHPDALNRVPGFTAEHLARLHPHVAAVPTPSRLNVNMASAEVLAAMVPNLDRDAARVLVAGREQAWFRNIGDFNARLPEGSGPLPENEADVVSRYVLAHGRARYGYAVVQLEVLLDRFPGWPTIVWHRLP
jgi:general secretion pathway protein K